MSHYTRLADDFDRVWQFSPDYEDWMVEKIASGLSLQPNQTWVDFGTCRVSTDWISYNYLKAQHLIAGCKTEIIELLASDQE
jgi:hypothetical protein